MIRILSNSRASNPSRSRHVRWPSLAGISAAGTNRLTTATTTQKREPR